MGNQSDDNVDGVPKHPILHGWPEFWWMGETDRANAFEARAVAHGGQGYRPRPPADNNPNPDDHQHDDLQARLERAKEAIRQRLPTGRGRGR